MDKIKGYPVKITGVGAAFPDRVVTNDDISKIVDTNDEWISSRTGIKQRRVVSANEGTVSLSVKASRDALGYAGLLPKDIDLIITATSLPDHLYPSTSCEVQGKIGADNAVGFDVVAACSGFVYGLSIANSFIKSGVYKKALVIGVDIHSRFLDWTDRNTCILFGDGAGAMIVERHEGEDEILAIDIHSDGSKAKELYIPLHGNNSPFVGANESKKQFVSMNGKEIYKFSVKVVPNAILDTLKNANLPLSELDYLIPHQANIRIINAIRNKLKLKEEQVIAKLENFGNTSSASIPIALTRAFKRKTVKVPSNITMVGFGAGLTWGVAVVRWTAKDKRL